MLFYGRFKVYLISEKHEKLPLVVFLDTSAERNKILKIWVNVLLPLVPSFKQIFHPVSAVDGYGHIGL